LPPIGLIAIYSYMKANGFDITFLDTQVGNWNEISLRRYLLKGNFDIIGISVFTTSAEASFYTARLVKDTLPKSVVVFGGVHATALPERTLEECQNCDFIILGEGELPFKRLIEKLEAGESYAGIKSLAYRDSNGKIIVNERDAGFLEPDTLPIGFFSDLDLSPYIPHITQYRRLPNYPLIIQRGCPYRCIFCDASTVHGKKIRTYSLDRVIMELRILKERHGARGIYFQDSTFTINKKFIYQLCEEMIRQKFNLAWACNTRANAVDKELLKIMKKAGCWQVVYGIESANQESLDLLKKGTTVEQNRNAISMAQESGIRVLASYIIGIPGEDEDMVQNTIDFANEMASEIALFYLPTPYPGTELYRICSDEGSIRKDVKWRDYISIDYNNPIYVNPKLGVEKMRYYYKKAFRSYYRNPRVYWANLKAIRSMDDIKKYWRALKIVIERFI
ncbi:MAG: radical SAM protein, partial [Candidatus Subteraquimicrobiales bacterium]|nr:radical SAM protein [Candidatus Subteraquimicrobiales bacterium]